VSPGRAFAILAGVGVVSFGVASLRAPAPVVAPADVPRDVATHDPSREEDDPQALLLDLEARLALALEAGGPYDDVLASGSPLRKQLGRSGPAPVPATRLIEILARSPGRLRLRQTAVGSIWSVDIGGPHLEVDRGRSLLVFEWTLEQRGERWLVHDRVLVQDRVIAG
jgi:hypothetical protein